MEFTFKKVVSNELIGCKLCKDIYFRPNRIDLVEAHLKIEHKIKSDNSSDSEENVSTIITNKEPLKNERVRSGQKKSPPNSSRKRKLSNLSRKRSNILSVLILSTTLSAWLLCSHWTLKSILRETLFPDQLHDFSLLSLNSFLQPFFKSKIM